MPDEANVTQLLQEWRHGDALAGEHLSAIVYHELHRLARGIFRNERSNHTLQPTALVHEAFLHLVGSDVEWKNRAHFFAVAARQMRRILVNHALARRTAKRGGGSVAVSVEEIEKLPSGATTEVSDIDDALERLAAFDERKSRILELHYFGGLTYDEMAEAMGLSTSTLHTELSLAKAWLRQELG